MKRINSILAAMAAALSLGAATDAGINSPSAAGFALRGELFYADRIYAATLDQMSHAARLNPDARDSESILFFSAMAALRSADPSAERLFAEFIERYPGSPLRTLATVGLGDCSFAAGNYEKAYEIYSRIDNRTLDNAGADDLTMRRSYAALMTGRTVEAEAGFTRLLIKPAYRDDAAFYTAYIAYSRHDYNRAVKLFERCAPTTSGPAAAAPYYIAQIRYLQGDWDQALTTSRRILAHPTCAALNPEAERIAGESLYNLGDTDAALPYLWRYASSTESPAPSAFYILGASEYNAGHYHEAIGLLQKAIGNETPMEQSAWLYLGQAYGRTGNNSAALMAFERAYRMNLDRKVTETAFYNFISAKTEGGQMPFASSSKLLEEFVNEYPDSPHAAEVGASLASGYLADNDCDAALRALSRVKSRSALLDQTRQRVLFVAATRDFANGSYKQALDRFSQARAIKADASIASQSLLWSADCEYRLGRYDKAIADYRAYLRGTKESATNRALAEYGLGYALFAKGDYSQALTSFRSFIDADRNAPAAQIADAFCRIGDCRYYASEPAAAETAYRQAFDANPAGGDYALYQIAVMKGLQRDHAGKIATLDRLAAEYPSSGLIADAMMQKAESQAARSDNAAAMATYEAVASAYPSAPQGRKAMLQLAIMRLAAGKRSLAVATYRQVVTEYPSSQEARVAVDDLKRIYADDGRLDELSALLASVPGAPSVDRSDYDILAYEAAEKTFTERGDASRLEKYLADYPSGVRRAEAKTCLASAAASAGRNEEALRLATELAERYPDADGAEDALVIKAEAETALGRVQPALETWRTLAERASSPAALRQARLGIMRSALALKRYDQALDAATLLQPDAAGTSEASEIGYSAGEALAALGKRDEAIARWHEVAQADIAGAFGARSAVAEAEALLAAGKLDSARRAADNLINANPPQPYWLARGFITLSDILRRQGNDFEADEYLRALRSNYPGSEKEIFRMIDERLKDK